jgi:hypothetical protein
MTVLAGFFVARAAQLGLDTPEGAAALEMSMRLDQRAERLAVTSSDIATRMAVSAGKKRVNPVHARILSGGRSEGTP